MLDKFQNFFTHTSRALSQSQAQGGRPWRRLHLVEWTADDNKHARGLIWALLSVGVSERHPLAWQPLGQRSVKKFREPGRCSLINVNKAKSAPQFICKALNIIDIMSEYYPRGTELYLIKHWKMLGPSSGRDGKRDRNERESIDALWSVEFMYCSISWKQAWNI